MKIPRPFTFLAVRHMAICGKIVSGHKQFNVASAISNFKKILSKNIRDFKIGHYGRLGRLDAYTGGLGP